MKIYIDNTEILNIDLTDQKLLENDLLDVNEWIKNAVIGKVENCWNRLQKEWAPKLMDDPNVTSIPATRDEFVAFVVARADYKNRAQRNAEALADQQAAQTQSP